MLRSRYIMGFVSSAASLAVTSLASASTFDSITKWTGSGANRAALVIDWNEAAGARSLVWGYRWDGPAPSAEQMFLDIVRADHKLFAKVGEATEFGVPVYGLGYDANPANGFAITTAGTFDSDGFALVDAGTLDEQGPVDGGTAAFSGDLYAEGWWSNGFWFQYASATDPFETGGAWRDAFGLHSETIANGSLIGLSFAPGFANTAPDSPVPEPTSALVVLALLVTTRRHRG